jgi:lipoprotein-anchoring transpeptidase ErfK/SrfK
MNKKTSAQLSRRSFLQSSIVSACSFLFQPFQINIPIDIDLPTPIGKGRITTTAIYRYLEPSFKSRRSGMLKRDELITLFDTITSPHGPAHNPRWYQISNGYIHSGYIQRVERARLNIPPLSKVRTGGQLGEISVPYTRSYRRVGTAWEPLYRLYFGSVHWITDVFKGSDRKTWYQLTDERLHAHYIVPSVHVHPIPDRELTPLSKDVPSEEKQIRVSIPEQKLIAYEGSSAVLQIPISSGIRLSKPPANGIPTETPIGRFRIGTKMPSKHMGEGNLTADIEAYELLGVPWVGFFHLDGYGLHGTYWHDNFGRRMSHGCINAPSFYAKWLYRWMEPVIGSGEWYRRGVGTVIEISD